METLNKKTHPLILIAAGSVSLASLAAAAEFGAEDGVWPPPEHGVLLERVRLRPGRRLR